MKVAICALAKHEEKYMKEWIDHHLQIGVDDIYIYDNNDDDKQKEIIDQYPDHVIRIDIRGLTKFNRKIPLDFYKEVTNIYDYVINIDLDEFVTFNPNQPIQNIKDFLQLNPDHKYYHMSWQIRVNNETLTYDDRPLKERFTEVLVTGEQYGKCIIATGINAFIDIHFCHCNYPCYNGNNELIICDMQHQNQKPNFKCLYLVHYNVKTPQEYIETKCKRNKKHNPYNFSIKYDLRQFYMYNKVTKESYDYLKQYLQDDTSYEKLYEEFKNNKYITIDEANKL